MSKINQSIDCKCDLKYTQLSVIDNSLLQQIKLVIFHNDGYGTENIIITTSDEIFGFGTNHNGRLGFGNKTKVNTPTKILELSEKKVKNVRFGQQLMIALTDLGDVYTAGLDKNGILGNGHNCGIYTKPQKIDINLIIVDIKCCNTRTILLTQTNEIYWFGYRVNVIQANTPTLLNNFNNKKVIQISTGCDHILALTQTAEVYSWGLNINGELGIAYYITSDTPQHIVMSNESVKQITCGYNHSLLLTSNGVIYSFGYNNCGQLGTGNISTENWPKCVPSDTEKFIEIFAFQNMSLALTENQSIYVWGQTKQNNILSPLKTNLNSFQEAIDFYCQNINTYKPLNRSDIFIKKPLNRVMQTTIKMFNNPKNSDLKFKIKRNENEKFDYIYGHKSFIEENSEHFKTIFSNEWIENQSNEIEISGYSYEPYFYYIKSLYTDCIETKDIEVLTELLSITEEYLDEDMKLKCTEQIKLMTTLLNVCPIYSSALKYRSKELGDYCFELMSKNIKHIVKSEDYKQMDSNDFRHFSTKMFNNPKNSDLKFKIKRKENKKFDYIYGHKYFIEENSEHFKTMFAYKWIENQINEILISDYSYEAYYQYIRCLYTDCIETEDIRVLIELLSITEEYLDEYLKLKCVEKIKPLTTLLNVCTLYSCALKYRSKELEDYCFEMMSNNIKSISITEEYDRMDSNDVKHFSTKYFQK